MSKDGERKGELINIMGYGQRKILSPRQESNPWSPKYREGGLPTELPELMESEPVPALQAATILVAMASGKNVWQLKFWWKSPIGDLQI